MRRHVLALVLAGTLGCTPLPDEPGERSGSCPAGTNCSPPDSGVRLSPRRVIAVGGTQLLEFRGSRYGFSSPRLVVDEPSVVDVDAILDPVWRNGERVDAARLVGRSPGTTRLTFFDSSGGPELLVDWITVGAAEVATVDVRPDTTEDWLSPLPDVFVPPCAIHVGLDEALPMTSTLRAADGTELADDDASIATPARGVVVPPVSGPSIAMEVLAAGTNRTVVVPVVDVVDRIEPFSSEDAAIPGLVCVVPRTSDGRSIVGAPLVAEFSTRSGETEEAEVLPVLRTCWGVPAGSGVLTVRAGTTVARFSLRENASSGAVVLTPIP